MHNSDKRISAVIHMADEIGKEAAAIKFSIQEDTIDRYYKEAKYRGIISSIPHKRSHPNVIVLDVENAFTKAGVWRMWKQDIHMNAITEEWYMLSWALKRLFSDPKDMVSDVLTPEEAIKGDDKRIMESIWEYVDAADIIIGHNLERFDIPKINTRCVINGLPPPMPFQTVDTLIAARRNFGFTSNKLDYLAKQFGVARKADNGGMERWIACTEGDPQALLDMEAYNRQDLIPTEEIYLCMRPYIKNHPNMGLYFKGDSDMCYKCGSTALSYIPDKFYYTGVNKYPAYRCNHCTSPGRSRFSAFGRGERTHITSAIAR